MKRCARRISVCLVAVAAAAGCGTKAPATTGATVTLTFSAEIDQVELTVTAFRKMPRGTICGNSACRAGFSKAEARAISSTSP